MHATATHVPTSAIRHSGARAGAGAAVAARATAARPGHRVPFTQRVLRGYTTENPANSVQPLYSKSVGERCTRFQIKGAHDSKSHIECLVVKPCAPLSRPRVYHAVADTSRARDRKEESVRCPARKTGCRARCWAPGTVNKTL